LLRALYFFIKTLRDVRTEQTSKELLLNVAKSVQGQLSDLATHLRRSEIGIQECDAAMNAIGAALPMIGTGGQPDPRINNLKQCQDAINITTKQIVLALSNMSKTFKANPEVAIASFSKTLGQGVVEMIKFNCIACNIVAPVNPTLSQSLNFNTNEVAISIGNSLQFTKSAVLNPKDPNAQQVLRQGFQTSASCLAKLLAAQKEFSALK